MMKKVDLKSCDAIAKEAAFHSTTEVNLEKKTEVNLESTNSSECFRNGKKLFWSLQQNVKDNKVIEDSVPF